MTDDHDDLDALLLVLCDTLDDLEGARIAMGNRLRALRDDKHITDGPEAARIAATAEALQAIEHGVELEVKRLIRRHPLGVWVRIRTGIGEKQGARLIASIGDPLWNDAEDRPRRGPAELWAYCGYHVIGGHAPRRARGERANWNPSAKMRAFLCAESAMKKRESPFRPVYDSARAKHVAAVHAEPCRRCGPAGRPAAPGSPLSDGHQHARALREVAKAILKDLFLFAAQQDRDELAA